MFASDILKNPFNQKKNGNLFQVISRGKILYLTRFKKVE